MSKSVCGIPALRLEHSPDLGRFFVANRLIREREILLQSEADAVAIYKDAFDSTCHSCLQSLGKGKHICGACKQVYCNTECFSAQHADEGMQCKLISRWEDVFATSPLAMESDCVDDYLLGPNEADAYGRLLLATCASPGVNRSNPETRLPESHAANTHIDYPASISDLCHHEMTHIADKRVESELRQLVALVDDVMRSLKRDAEHRGCSKETGIEMSVEALEKRLLQLYYNSVVVRSRQYQQIGIGVHSSLALFNHSCVYNAGWGNDGRVFTVRAVETIFPGDSVCISYIPDMHLDLVERQKMLSRYCFVCQCQRCIREQK